MRELLARYLGGFLLEPVASASFQQGRFNTFPNVYLCWTLCLKYTLIGPNPPSNNKPFPSANTEGEA